jgi:hypothetical protein
MAKDRFGSIVISVILGLGLAAIFRRVCTGDSCVVVKAPSSKDIDENVFKIDSSCYKYTPNLIPCPLKKGGAVPAAASS